MIAWTTAREVAFEKVCSTSESFTNTESNSGAEGGSKQDVFSGSGGTSSYSFSNASESGITSNLNVGTTINQTGSNFSQSGQTDSYFGSTFYSSYGTTVTDELEDGTIRTQVFSYSTQGSSYTPFSTSFETSGSDQFTTVKQTTTTESFTIDGSTTSSSTQESAQWTTQTNSSDSDVTGFALTEAAGTWYFVKTTSFARTRTIVTSSGTTKGNARDTIYMADSSEVLWVINENPEWSNPLTNNAASATQTTISDLREAVGLVTAADPPQTIDSSESISSYTFTGSSASSMTVTVNYSPAFVNAETVTQDIGISVAGSQQSGELRVSGQAEVVYVGGTETVAASSATIAMATLTDLFGGSWQKTALVYSTVANTISIDNAVETFTISGGTASSCYGNTTKAVGVVGGYPVIASPPSMTVYSPAGVKLGDSVGLRFTGDGITETYFTESETVTISYLQTANDGELTRYTTASPVVPSWVTLSSNSFTYVTTTLEDGETVDTEISGEFGIDGATWQTVARARGDGLLGGDLAQGETALMRINRGLYKNQSGGTSFFAGHDTTYIGTKDTTYWYPISYLQPAFGRSVFAVPRNTSTWPA